MRKCCRNFIVVLRQVKVWLIIILTPLLFLPLPILFPSPAGKCAYVIIIMGFYWMTEVIPMAATALLPLVLMPWLGIVSSKDICKNYFKDANMLFFGGLLVAVAVERWMLHKRIALRVLLIVGSQPCWLMFGFMLTTTFLSMWISNTATTAMMVPIAHAVMMELRQHQKTHVARLSQQFEVDLEMDQVQRQTNDEQQQEQHNTEQNNNAVGSTTNEIENVTSNQNEIHPESRNSFHERRASSASKKRDSESNKRRTSLKRELSHTDEWLDKAGRGMRLCIAYSASIGGMATLTGTGPNLVLKGQVDMLYGDDAGISFSSWMVFAFPVMLCALPLAWLWLAILFMGPRELLYLVQRRKTASMYTAGRVIREEYNKLGRMSFAEAAVLGHFTVLVLLWLTREPQFMPGWASVLSWGKYVTDSTVAMTVAVALFFFPSELPFSVSRKGGISFKSVPSLLDWPTVHKQMAWGVIILLGGGFALADACQVSGLSNIIGEVFVKLEIFPRWVIALILTTTIAAFTEVTSNVASATIFLPILAKMAEAMHVHPLYFMIPVTIATSFAFMLPVATPPNAIVFAYGDMKIIHMMRTGVMLNVVCLAITQIAINTWGAAFFHLNEYPDWLQNKTLQEATNMTTIGP